MVAALEIDIGEIPRVDWKGGALEGPALFVNQAGRILIRAAEEWAAKHEPATAAAPNAFPFPNLLLILNVTRIHRAKDKPPHFIRQLAEGSGATGNELPEAETRQRGKRHVRQVVT
jgi:hypothetical protein